MEESKQSMGSERMKKWVAYKKAGIGLYYSSPYLSTSYSSSKDYEKMLLQNIESD